MASTGLASRALALDQSIRSVMLVDRNANILEAANRVKTDPLLTDAETRLGTLQSILRIGLSDTNEQKLGKMSYMLRVHEKVKYATIPVGQEHAILALSFDPLGDHESIIVKKILPFLKAEGF
jgi:hypothetical protein